MCTVWNSYSTVVWRDFFPFFYCYQLNKGKFFKWENFTTKYLNLISTRILFFLRLAGKEMDLQILEKQECIVSNISNKSHGNRAYKKNYYSRIFLFRTHHHSGIFSARYTRAVWHIWKPLKFLGVCIVG